MKSILHNSFLLLTFHNASPHHAISSFPDIGYYRSSVVQSHLASILFLCAVLHPDVGYRQGMHELLAPLYYAVDYDSLPDTPDPDDLAELCARTWVAADAWALFDRVMVGAGQWFEWREAPQRQLPAVAHGAIRYADPSGVQPRTEGTA